MIIRTKLVNLNEVRFDVYCSDYKVRKYNKLKIPLKITGGRDYFLPVIPGGHGGNIFMLSRVNIVYFVFWFACYYRAAKMSQKRKHNTLTLLQKLEIVNKLDQSEPATKLPKIFKVTKYIITDIKMKCKDNFFFYFVASTSEWIS